jgi:hypothetical protein
MLLDLRALFDGRFLRINSQQDVPGPACFRILLGCCVLLKVVVEVVNSGFGLKAAVVGLDYLGCGKFTVLNFNRDSASASSKKICRCIGHRIIISECGR